MQTAPPLSGADGSNIRCLFVLARRCPPWAATRPRHRRPRRCNGNVDVYAHSGTVFVPRVPHTSRMAEDLLCRSKHDRHQRESGHVLDAVAIRRCVCRRVLRGSLGGPVWIVHVRVAETKVHAAVRRKPSVGSSGRDGAHTRARERAAGQRDTLQPRRGPPLVVVPRVAAAPRDLAFFKRVWVCARGAHALDKGVIVENKCLQHPGRTRAQLSQSADVRKHPRSPVACRVGGCVRLHPEPPLSTHNKLSSSPFFSVFSVFVFAKNRTNSAVSHAVGFP